MAVYATNADVESALGRPLSVPEGLHVNALLILASALVDSETNNYKFGPGSYTVGRRVRPNNVSMYSAGIVRLPAIVATVDQVREVNPYTGIATILTANTNYTYRGKRLYIFGISGRFTYALERSLFVEVDFTITAPVPDDIVALVAGMVASTLSDPALAAANAISGSYPVARTTSVAKVWLSASDKAILRRKYRNPKYALDLLS
jgi:hypothetical protein